MAAPSASSGTISFGAFEADLRSGELRKDGVKVKLEGQPFQVLAVLLTRPGEVVTREELRKGLWPGDTFVDFEQGINAAVKRLRLALEDSADTPTFIETLPRRGYRFIARVENGAQPAPPATEESQLGTTFAAEEAVSRETRTTQSAVVRRATARRRRRTLIGLAAITALVLLVFGLNLGGLRDRLLGRPLAGEITSIAVLPLENLTGDPKQEYFVDGMTEALITELGKISALRGISRTSAMAFKGTKKTLPEIARQLGVDAVLEGAVSRNGDRVRMSARLIQAAKERVLWSESYERDLRDISTLQSEIVLVIADETKVKLLNQEQARLAQVRPVNPRAYEAYLMGRYLQAKTTNEDMPKALAYFQRAVELDPGYAPAYVGIIGCYAIGGGRNMGVTPKEATVRTKETALKVVQLDGTSAAAHHALAMVKLDEWDFPGAEKEFERALELNPGDAQLHQHYGHYLRTIGRHGESIREYQHALTLDPLSPLLTADLGWTYWLAREYDLALKQGRKALEMEPNFLFAQNVVAASNWNKGLVEEALESGWPSPVRPELNRRAKEIYKRAGARAMLRWLVEDAGQRKARGDPISRSSWIAAYYVELDDKEQAFAWLEKAYQEHEPTLPLDMASPQFDPVRSHPRFQDLLRRIGLPP